MSLTAALTHTLNAAVRRAAEALNHPCVLFQISQWATTRGQEQHFTSVLRLRVCHWKEKGTAQW